MENKIDLMKMINFANNLEGDEQEFYVSTMESFEKTLMSIAFDPRGNVTAEYVAKRLQKSQIAHLNLVTLEAFMTGEYVHPKSNELWNAMDVFLERCDDTLTEYEKKYFEGLRLAQMSIYEIIDVEDGQSLTVRDLVADGNPTFVVQESEPSISLPKWSLIGTKLVRIGDEIRTRSAILQFDRQHVDRALTSLKASKALLESGLGSLDNKTLQKTLRETQTNLVTAVWVNGCVPPPKSRTYLNRDGEKLKHCKHTFPLKATKAAVAKRLNEIEELQNGEDDKWVWLIPMTNESTKENTKKDTRQENTDEQQFVQLHAGMQLKNDMLIVETLSEQRATQIEFLLKENLEDMVGEPTLELQDIDEAQTSKDFVKQKEQKFSPENVKELSEMIDGYCKIWLSNKTPNLNNLSPREAVKTPEGRRKVISLLKSLEISFNETFKHQKDYTYNSDWLFEDLGIKASEL
ncbi:MAG: hypothetical protein ABFQ95_00600 [Pseudomonadota bacterium]